MPLTSQIERHRLLLECPLFKAFARPDLDQLAMRLVERRFLHGQRIFSRGDPGSYVALVLQGRVRLGATSPEGRMVLFDIAGPGEVLGEVALLDGRGRSADATALGACHLLLLDRRDLLPVLHRSPEVALRLSGILCERLRVTKDRLEGAVLLTVKARLARLLLALPERNSRDDVVDLPSQGDIGCLIGASRQQVNHHLRRWLEDGVLHCDRHRLRIIDRGKLADIAGVADGGWLGAPAEADRLPG